MSNSEDKKQTAAERAWAVRRARMRRILLNFAVLVGGPTLLAVLYYGLWASNEYVSVTVVAIQSPQAGQQQLAGAFASNREDDMQLVKTTLSSRAALLGLEESVNWREHYAEHGNIFSRLGSDSGSEEAFEYYSDRLKISGAKGTALRMSVRAFSAEAAQEFSKALLAIADSRLNEVALRPLIEQEKVAAKRLSLAKAAVAAAPPAPATSSLEQPTSLARTSALEELANAKSLLATIELAKVARRRYLTVISGPSAPSEAVYPKRLWSITTVFVVAFSLMGVIGLLLGAVREHAKV